MSRPSWPKTQREWREYAAWAISIYPLMGTDWDAHAAKLESSRTTAEPAGFSDYEFADIEPDSPEEEERAYALGSAPTQLQLF